MVAEACCVSGLLKIPVLACLVGEWLLWLVMFQDS